MFFNFKNVKTNSISDEINIFKFIFQYLGSFSFLSPRVTRRRAFVFSLMFSSCRPSSLILSFVFVSSEPQTATTGVWLAWRPIKRRVSFFASFLFFFRNPIRSIRRRCRLSMRSNADSVSFCFRPLFAYRPTRRHRPIIHLRPNDTLCLLHFHRRRRFLFWRA